MLVVRWRLKAAMRRWASGRGEALFPLSYTRQVLGQIAAPDRDLLVADCDVHLLFNEDIGAVLPPLLGRLHDVVPAASAC